MAHTDQPTSKVIPGRHLSGPNHVGLKRYDWLDLTKLISDEVSGTGWDQLLDGLLSEIDEIISGSSATLSVLQIKEKFGQLRFYRRLRSGSPAVADRIGDAVKRAEDASQETCFSCGQLATMRNAQGWIVPLCQEHWEHRMGTGGTGARADAARAQSGPNPLLSGSD